MFYLLHHQQEVPANPAASATTKELQSSTVSSVILEPVDRDSLGNVIVEPMDRVVLDSTVSPGNNLTSSCNGTMDSTSSPGNTPTPTGCASPTMGPMMEVSFIINSMIIMIMINIIIIMIIINIMIRRKRRILDQCCRRGGLLCSSW